MKNFTLLNITVLFSLCLFSTSYANINLDTDMAFVNEALMCGLVKTGEDKGNVEIYEQGQAAVSGSVTWAHTSVGDGDEYYEFKLERSGSYAVAKDIETGLYKLSKIGLFKVTLICEDMSFVDVTDFPY